MKLYSWNVNGIRAVHKKGLLNFLESYQPDILCLQETKAEVSQLEVELLQPANYKSHFSSAIKKGYSGVANYYNSNLDLKVIANGIGIEKFDQEGRFILSHCDSFYLYNIYFPSGTTGDLRQEFKYEFLEALYEHLAKLPEGVKNKLIICGDFNICHKDLDIHHPEKARKQELSGFLEPECQWVDRFIDLGFIDTFRMQNPSSKQYSWWSYRAGARAKNLGWRIDYFFVSKGLKDQVKSAGIMSEIMGSDHCPVYLELVL